MNGWTSYAPPCRISMLLFWRHLFIHVLLRECFKKSVALPQYKSFNFLLISLVSLLLPTYIYYHSTLLLSSKIEIPSFWSSILISYLPLHYIVYYTSFSPLKLLILPTFPFYPSTEVLLLCTKQKQSAKCRHCQKSNQLDKPYPTRHKKGATRNRLLPFSLFGLSQ
jgi:hypothetical protein